MAHSVGVNFIFRMLLPLIVTIPFSCIYFQEKSDSIIYLTITRFHSVKRYYFSSMIVVFLTASFIILIPLLLNIALTSITFPHYSLRDFSNLTTASAYYYEKSSEVYISIPYLFVNYPYLFNYLTAVKIALFAGFAGVFSYAFSYFIKRKRIFVYMSFFIVYHCMELSSFWLSRYNINISLLSYLFIYDLEYPIKNNSVFLITSGVLVFSVICMVILGQRKLKNIL
jgi:hypothetical protein